MIPPPPPPPPPPWLIEGPDESYLEIGVNGGPRDRGPVAFQPGDTLEIAMNVNTEVTLTGLPIVWGLNLGAAATQNAVTLIPGSVIPELDLLHPASVPSSPVLLTIFSTIGSTVSIPLPLSLVFAPGSLLKFQGLYVNPVRGPLSISGIVTTNTAYFYR